MNDQKLHILYRLQFPDDKFIEFPILIDESSCTFILDKEITPNYWAALDYQQCPNCTLNKTKSPFCPVAVNLTPALSLCSSLTSYQSVTMEVFTAERTVSGTTTMQRALGSIFGLIMATSPCPHTEYLKPMARFHLPLASELENTYRTIAMHLLGQYFRRDEGMDFNPDLAPLTALHQNLQIVNQALTNRLKPAILEDSSVNAVLVLDLLSQAATWSIGTGLEEIRRLFKSYRTNPETR